MRTYAEIFKAMADETRLTILFLILRHGEMCVCDVEGVLGVSQSKASRHLRYLRNAGLLTDRRDGIWVYYNIPDNADSDAWRVIAANKQLILSMDNAEMEHKYLSWMSRKQAGESCGLQLNQ